MQLIRPNGVVLRPPGETRALPVDDRTLEVARIGKGHYFSDANVGGDRKISVAGFSDVLTIQ